MKTRASDSTVVDLKPFDTGSPIAISQPGPEVAAITRLRRATEELGTVMYRLPAHFATLCSRERLVAYAYSEG